MSLHIFLLWIKFTNIVSIGDAFFFTRLLIFKSNLSRRTYINFGVKQREKACKKFRSRIHLQSTKTIRPRWIITRFDCRKERKQMQSDVPHLISSTVQASKHRSCFLLFWIYRVSCLNENVAIEVQNIVDEM